MSAVLGHALTARGYSIATASCKGKYISVMPIKLFAGETHSVLSRTNGWNKMEQASRAGAFGPGWRMGQILAGALLEGVPRAEVARAAGGKPCFMIALHQWLHGLPHPGMRLSNIGSPSNMAPS